MLSFHMCSFHHARYNDLSAPLTYPVCTAEVFDRFGDQMLQKKPIQSKIKLVFKF